MADVCPKAIDARLGRHLRRAVSGKSEEQASAVLQLGNIGIYKRSNWEIWRSGGLCASDARIRLIRSQQSLPFIYKRIRIRV